MAIREVFVAAGLAFSVSVGLFGCGSDKKETKMAEAPLYERLGGEQSIKAVCADFVGRAAKDPQVNFFRKDVPGYPEWKPSAEEVAAFNKHLVEFVCMATGGPQKYEGKSMKESHAGMKITEAQFNAMAADLAATLEAFKVPAREKGELLGAVARTKKDIVEVR